MDRTYVPVILLILCILVWIMYAMLHYCSVNIRCVYFLTATYLTEPGIIPKGSPLSPDQIKDIAETHCTKCIFLG